jgi:hypothetical protein
MVWRAQYGERNGIFGGWFSKPGIDVTLAQPGEFLLDTSSQVYQTVAKGDTVFVANPQASTSYSKSIVLDPQFAPYSNLFMWADAYVFDNSTGGVFTNYNFASESMLDIRFNVVSGVVQLTCVCSSIFPPMIASRVLRASWSVFRAQF